MTKRKGPRVKRGPFLSVTIPLDIALIVLGLLAAIHRPSPQWVEQNFSNGYYPHWQNFWYSFTPSIPFALGDAIIGAGALLIIASLVFVRPFWRALLGIAALAGFYLLWFYAGWGYGYERAPLESRTAFSQSRITPGAVDTLRNRLVAQMNALAPIAHEQQRVRATDDPAVPELIASWTPVVQRLGNNWQPRVSAAKPAAAGWYMDLSGTSGFTNPFTLETQLAPDLLWFERPFAQAHEWSHAAGFNREDEANYIAALTCLRAAGVTAQYSGALELFLYLPPLKKYPHSMFVPQVWADFAAIRKRNAHFVNLNLSRFSWRVYNSYLKSNNVASGVQNYDEVTKLIAGIPLDAQGLPISGYPRSSAAPAGAYFWHELLSCRIACRQRIIRSVAACPGVARGARHGCVTGKQGRHRGRVYI